MSTIVSLIGAATGGLIIAGAVVWGRRVHRELQELKHEVRATRQELEIQRIIISDNGQDGPPKRRRHLRALAVLAPVFLLFKWIRQSPCPATATAAVASFAALVILV